MSAEAAALRLGTTVVKAAAQAWLGSKRREQERRLPMDDLVRRRVAGLRQQRSVQRQFEEMADTVAARIEPFLAQEFRGLDESGREAALNGVCDTFAHADLSDEAFLAADAQPAELIRSITASVSPPVGLSEPETRLYELLFSECCEYYVSIVRTLPVFEERTLAELLARTSSLSDRVARVLERLPDRSLFAPDGTDQDHRIPPLVHGAGQQHPRRGGAVPPYVRPRRRAGTAVGGLRQPAGHRGRRHPPPHGPRPAAQAGPERLGGVRDGEFRHAGGVGAGRGVPGPAARRGRLRQDHAAPLAGDHGGPGAFTAELADWNGLTPVFVKLREYSGRPLPKKPEELLDGVAGNITGIMPRGWVERQLRDNKVLLLVDGVDELLGSERRSVRDWLRKLLATYGGIRMVVTSRPTAAGADWLRREDFTALHLDRMTPPDLAAFVRQWHEAVRELGDELPCGVDELPRYEQSLLNSLKDRAHLQSLAGTPLLAAMLCAMHLNRGSQLPRDRMELYRNALHTLVHDRDADRNVPSALNSKLSLGDKLVVLRIWHGACRTTTAARSPWTRRPSMSPRNSRDAAPGGTGRPWGPGTATGPLRHPPLPVEGRLDFVHRTFQEYSGRRGGHGGGPIGTGRAGPPGPVARDDHHDRGDANSVSGRMLDGSDRAGGGAGMRGGCGCSRLLCQETLRTTFLEGLARRLDGAMSALLSGPRETDPPALAAVGTSLSRAIRRVHWASHGESAVTDGADSGDDRRGGGAGVDGEIRRGPARSVVNEIIEAGPTSTRTPTARRYWPDCRWRGTA